MNKLEFLFFLNDLVQEDEATYSSHKTRGGLVHQWIIGADCVQWHEDALLYRMDNDLWFDDGEEGFVALVDESDFQSIANDFCEQLERTPKIKPQSGCLIL